MKKFIIILLLFSCVLLAQAQKQVRLFSADHPYIQFTGRVDHSNPKLPRFWQPGVYFNFRFTGSSCEIILHDEILWGKSHNYIEVVLDGKPIRMQTKNAIDTIKFYNLKRGKHTLLICKNTEANIGFLALAGIRCESLIKSTRKPSRKIEFIGNSITSAQGVDNSLIPCGTKEWYDQHSAYFGYGAVTSRALNAQYHLSSVSGIGLMHSCCNLEIIMPLVYDKVSMRNDTIPWNFKNYQPDVVTVCLGQNDGIQDSIIFLSNYIAFINQLRTYYPNSSIICLTSPMANDALRLFMRNILKTVVETFHTSGDKKVYSFIFEKQYIKGCDSHPSMQDHKEIATLLTAFIKQKMNW